MLNRHSKALNIENTILDDWRKSMIISIPKKGNSTALDNQRGIAKTCSSAKLFNKVLLSRLKPIIDPQLSQCQSGFCAGRSTTEQVMALRCLIDNCRVTNMTASLVFVNFQKAFDTLHRSSIPVILSQYNVPNCLISDIIQMYSDTSACVSTELGPTEWFKTTSGVLQGDTISLYLFIVLLYYAMRRHYRMLLVLWSVNGMAVGILLSISMFSYTLMISVFWPNLLTMSNVHFIGLSALPPKSA